MLWQLVLIATIVWLCVCRWKDRNKWTVSKQLKSDLVNLPFIGHTLYFLGDKEVLMGALKKFARQAIKYDGTSKLCLGNSFFCVVSDPVIADAVAKAPNCLEKDDIMDFIRVLTGNGSIFAEVPIWRPRRKVLAPTFTIKNLKQFSNVFVEQSDIMVKQMKSCADKDSFSLWKFITSYTMDSVCETTLGTKLCVQNHGHHPFLKVFETTAQLITKRIFLPLVHDDFIFKMFCTAWRSEILSGVKYITDFVLNIIEEKKKDIALTKLDSNSNEIKQDSENPRIKSFLEMLIESSGGENGYTNLELQEETLVLLLAGTDTSAVGASFTTILMAKYPEVQEKVYQEIKEIFGDSDRPITPEDLPRLRYLEAVLKECLRLYPPVPIIVRKTIGEVDLPNGVKLLPGIGVMIHIWGIHHNPKYWGEDVEVFRPERFFDSPPTHPSAFFAFSSGPRQCLGYQYAMMSMKTAVASIIRNYEVLPAPYMELNKHRSLRVEYDVMMKHVDKFEVKLRSRK